MHSSTAHVADMASHFQIQKPYVLTQLPKPLNPSKSGYVVGEVAGQRAGSRKRKRPEVAVGIDGEALNIYDVSHVFSHLLDPFSWFLF